MKVIIFSIMIVGVSTLSGQVLPVSSKVYAWNSLQVEKMETSDRRQIIDGSATDLERLEIHATTLLPGKAPHAAHTHTDMEELIIVKEGKLKATIKGETKILGPGSIALVIPREEHGFENGGDADVTYYIIKHKSRVPMNVDRAKKAGGSFTIEWNSLTEKQNAKGSRRDFFERPTSMVDRFEMHVTKLNPGLSSHDPHTHRAEEIILMVKGSARMQIDDRHENASAGDLIFLGSGVSHSLTNTGTEPCEYFAFQWQ